MAELMYHSLAVPVTYHCMLPAVLSWQTANMLCPDARQVSELRQQQAEDRIAIRAEVEDDVREMMKEMEEEFQAWSSWLLLTACMLSHHRS